MAADLERIELDIDAQAVELVSVSALEATFTAQNDRLTFFFVQNDSSDTAMVLTIDPTAAYVKTPEGMVEPEPIEINIDADDSTLYCFRVPAQVYNGLDGLVTFERGATVGKIGVYRFPASEEYRGGITAPQGETNIRVPVTQIPAAVTLVENLDGEVFRKGYNAVWIVRQASGSAKKLVIQTLDSIWEKNFGHQFGVMRSEFEEFPESVPFLTHPVSIPGDESLVIFVRPIGAYSGGTLGDHGAVFSSCEGDTVFAAARLDLQV